MTLFHLPRRFSRRGEKKKRSSLENSPEREPRALARTDEVPSGGNVHLPPTSIANIVLDATNYAELERTASAPESKAKSSMANKGDITYIHSDTELPKSESALSFPTRISSAGGGTPSHRPSHSLSDIVFDPVMLSALYEARETELSSTASHHDSSSNAPSPLPPDRSGSAEE